MRKRSLLYEARSVLCFSKMWRKTKGKGRTGKKEKNIDRGGVIFIYRSRRRKRKDVQKAKEKLGLGMCLMERKKKG